MPRTSLAMASRSALLSGCELSFSCSSTAASLENSWSRELFERAALSSVLGEPAGSAAAGAEAACRGEGCGVERAVASGGLLATGVTRCCCCDAAPSCPSHPSPSPSPSPWPPWPWRRSRPCKGACGWPTFRGNPANGYIRSPSLCSMSRGSYDDFVRRVQVRLAKRQRSDSLQVWDISETDRLAAGAPDHRARV